MTSQRPPQIHQMPSGAVVRPAAGHMSFLRVCAHSCAPPPHHAPPAQPCRLLLPYFLQALAPIQSVREAMSNVIAAQRQRVAAAEQGEADKVRGAVAGR